MQQLSKKRESFKGERMVTGAVDFEKFIKKKDILSKSDIKNHSKLNMAVACKASIKR